MKAIIEGTAPQPARLAAARGMLPLPQDDLLEILVALGKSADKEMSAAAHETLEEQNNDDLLVIAKIETRRHVCLAI